MRKYLITTPWWLKRLYPSLVWNHDRKGDSIYITFDDGPHPEITRWVINQLEEFGMKASFFLIGDNHLKYPDVTAEILKAGHAIGNHTQHHLNGWSSTTKEYLTDVNLAKGHINSHLFRPPYGKIKRSSIVQLSKSFQIIMWDVLSADFDVNLNAKQCASNVINNLKAGSIIVFHDSEKAWPRLEKALPQVLRHIAASGLKTATL